MGNFYLALSHRSQRRKEVAQGTRRVTAKARADPWISSLLSPMLFSPPKAMARVLALWPTGPGVGGQALRRTGTQCQWGQAAEPGPARAITKSSDWLFVL